MKEVLLTGGLGFIGSHTAVELVEKGYEIVIIDDLSNSEEWVLDRIQSLSGREIPFYKGDIADEAVVSKIFREHEISAVIHFAAKKAVGESVQEPLMYYDININGLLNLLKITAENPVSKFIFSSSCTVYGNPKSLPVKETSDFGETPSPYGKTKQICEYILADYSKVSDLSITSLRYFNPVGAHPTSKIGELPRGVPNNLVPFITQAAAGVRSELKVFGGDYNTPDGTAIRDFIHVMDLAAAHVAALAYDSKKYSVFNLGTGIGYSVLDVIKTFETINGVKVPYEIVERREGDLPEVYGDPDHADKELAWRAKYGLEDMMRDAWNWQKTLR